MAQETSKKSKVQTKQETVLGLLRWKNGASLAGMVDATGWQAHSVRGFLSSIVKKKLRLKLGCRKTDADVRNYFLRSAL